MMKLDYHFPNVGGGKIRRILHYSVNRYYGIIADVCELKSLIQVY